MSKQYSKTKIFLFLGWRVYINLPLSELTGFPDRGYTYTTKFVGRNYDTKCLKVYFRSEEDKVKYLMKNL